MKNRTLGNGQAVSSIGLGCMGMDHAYGKPAPRKDMVKLLRHAVDLGCTFFDTAVVYGEANEELLGEAFSSVREQVVLATKFGITGQRIEDGKTVNLLDPCCGTGDAVLRLALGHDSRCYGIELDEERAGLAEQKLFRVAYGDFFSSYVGNRSFHAILLNPPYLTVTLGCGLRGRDEKRFLVEAFQALVMGGLMIYIVPYYRMTEDVCQIFTDNFSDISVYRFLDGEFGKFKQIAVLGTRKPRESDEAASASLYTAALHPESLRTLDQLPEGRYQLPDAALDVKIFRGSVFNESELAHQLMASQSLERLLQKDGQEQEMGRPPLPLSIGQVGLIGGSGLINGLMQCDCPHIIKGRIIKERHERREENHSERGELISTDVIETITNRMVFNILTPTGFRSLV